jgi:hypothetical protein
MQDTDIGIAIISMAGQPLYVGVMNTSTLHHPYASPLHLRHNTKVNE